MIDNCSQGAYDSLRAKNKIRHDQLSVLNIFRKVMRPLTTREAFDYAIKDGLSIDFAGVKSRITEMTSKDEYDGKPLEKLGKDWQVKCPVTGKRVNRWQLKIERKVFQTDFFKES